VVNLPLHGWTCGRNQSITGIYWRSESELMTDATWMPLALVPVFDTNELHN
jgi:hypothetical protein